MTLKQKIQSLWSALLSLRGGLAAPAQSDARLAKCYGIGTDAACEGFWNDDNKGYYCNQCGCPKWPLSDLRIKTTIPGAQCPLGKWDK